MGMSNINTGGPAFPVLHWISGESTSAEEGMTLRDYFAAKALSTILGQYDFTFFEDDEKAQPEDTLALCLARNSYTMADAMLKAREHCADAGPADVEELFMTECQHKWTPVEGQPMYKCIRCNAFMVICK
jgi:hypothetical protein